MIQIQTKKTGVGMFALLFAIILLPAFDASADSTSELISGDLSDSDSGLNLTDTNPSVAYNSTRNEYLVVWQGLKDRNSDDENQSDREIFAARVTQVDGVLTKTILNVSNAGGDDPIRDSFNPSVAYNKQNDEYLVVWHGDDPQGGDVAFGEFEIFGQRLGYEEDRLVEIGDSDFRITTTGAASDAAIDAENAVVAYNSMDNQYLVAFQAESIDGEYEIYGVILNADGSKGKEVFQISNAGLVGNTDQDALYPSVAYNETLNEYLVVWEADALGDLQEEIYAQRIGADGEPLGIDDMRVSQTGDDGNPNFFAQKPDVAWNSQDNEFLVVFEAIVYSEGDFNHEKEIQGQRLAYNAESDLVEQGSDARISDTGDDNDSRRDATEPKVTYDSKENQFIVVWTADDIGRDEEYEIYGQAVDAAGEEIGFNDIRLTYTGPDDSIEFGAARPDVVFGETDNEIFVVWEADYLMPLNVEIFGQFLSIGESFGFPPDTSIKEWSIYN